MPLDAILNFQLLTYYFKIFTALTLLGVAGYRRLFPWRAKLPERETDRSPPCSAKFKNQWCYISTHHICLREVDYTYSRGAQSTRARTREWQNFVWHQYGTCFISPSWRLELWGGCYIIGKNCTPLINSLRFIAAVATVNGNTTH
jgi:hypothetical protein